MLRAPAEAEGARFFAVSSGTVFRIRGHLTWGPKQPSLWPLFLQPCTRPGASPPECPKVVLLGSAMQRVLGRLR